MPPNLTETLTLTDEGDDVFSAQVLGLHPGRRTLYGGLVAAQALRAASQTVGADAIPASLHSYFVRGGDPQQPLRFEVLRVRDGRSFAVRRVAAVQDGEEIYSLITLFQRGADLDAPELDLLSMADVPPPEECPEFDWEPHLFVRAVTRPRRAASGKQLYPDTIWLRPREPIGADLLLSACALTYLSDLGAGFGQNEDPRIGVGGPSLDHSLWFHAPGPLDEWTLLHAEPMKAIAFRGVYRITLRDRSGRLRAMATQEALLRPPRGEGKVSW